MNRPLAPCRSRSQRANQSDPVRTARPSRVAASVVVSPRREAYRQKASTCPRTVRSRQRACRCPTGPAEQLEFAGLCPQPYQRRYASSAHFYAGAFDTQPNRGDDLGQQHRYSAPCGVFAGRDP
jgi:hypothetical protein